MEITPFLAHIRRGLDQSQVKPGASREAVAEGKKVTTTLAQLGSGEEEVMRDLKLIN